MFSAPSPRSVLGGLTPCAGVHGIAHAYMEIPLPSTSFLAADQAAGAVTDLSEGGAQVTPNLDHFHLREKRCTPSGQKGHSTRAKHNLILPGAGSPPSLGAPVRVPEGKHLFSPPTAAPEGPSEAGHLRAGQLPPPIAHRGLRSPGGEAAESAGTSAPSCCSAGLLRCPLSAACCPLPAARCPSAPSSPAGGRQAEPQP